LRFHGTPYDTCTRRGPHLRKLLATVEEGWPPRLDDPLPPGKLKDTLDYLNRRLSGRPLSFGRDGAGEGVVWSAEPPPSS
jgi:hypothetical protein